MARIWLYESYRYKEHRSWALYTILTGFSRPGAGIYNRARSATVCTKVRIIITTGIFLLSLL